MASFSPWGIASTYPASHRQYAENQEQHTRDEDRAERDLPCVAQTEDHTVGEERVESHAWRQRNRVVGVQPHHQSAERSGQTSGNEHRVERHASLGEDLRVDKAIVRNVVTPALTSVRTSVPCCASLKKLSSVAAMGSSRRFSLASPH